MPPLRCPACRNVNMRPQVDSDTSLEIDACPKCYGLWFDAHELARFLKSPNLKNRYLWDDHPDTLQASGYTINTTRRACPRCKVVMSERIFAGVTLDVCGQCSGIWFDDGEVRLIVEKYKSGQRGGDGSVVGELKEGLGKGGDKLHLGIFGSLMEFIKSART